MAKHHVEAICILILPGEAQSARRILEREIREGNLTLVDQDFLRQMLAAGTPGAPLRQVLRRSISLETASPFHSEGHVDKDRHVFVAPGNLLDKLRNGNSWVIWGGRRSGKTTLLMAVKNHYESLRKDPFRTAYLSLEDLPSLDVGAVDLVVAKRIAGRYRLASATGIPGGIPSRLDGPM